MKKVQNAQNHEKALDELLGRYESGATYDRSPELTEQKTREIEMRTNVRKTYNVTREIKHDAAELDTAVLLDRIDQARYGKKDNMNKKENKNDIKSKLQAEADRANPKGLKRQETPKSKSLPKKKSGSSSKIKEVIKDAAKTWIPLEEREQEKIVKGGKTKLPGTLILAIIVITVSLFMIVGSAVLLGSAQSEQNELEDKIALLDKEIAELRTDLDRKNANADIEIFAKEELGMITQEHVNFEYINSNKADEFEKQEAEKVSFRSLLTWIFQQFD